MNYFLEIFIDFFIFLNSNSNLKFGTSCYRSVPLPYPAVTTFTAVYRAVTDGKKNHAQSTPARRPTSAVAAPRATAPTHVPKLVHHHSGTPLSNAAADRSTSAAARYCARDSADANAQSLEASLLHE
jgi:hypothetical protein